MMHNANPHKANPQCRIRHCYLCPRDTQFFCLTCNNEMCFSCKKTHVQNLKTLDHNVVLYQNKSNTIARQEICSIHSKNTYEKFCKHCELPVCFKCIEHIKHKKNQLRSARNKKIQECRGSVHIIRRDAICYGSILRSDIEADYKNSCTKISNYLSDVYKKAKLIKYRLNHVSRGFDFKHRCLKQMKKLNRYISSLQNYEQSFDESVNGAVRFLLFIKKNCLLMVQDTSYLTLHTNNFFCSESLTKKNVAETLCTIQMRDGNIRCLGTNRLLKVMSSPELYQTVRVRALQSCTKLACIASDKFWVGDNSQVLLSNTKSDILYCRKNRCWFAEDAMSLTTNSKGHLIFVNEGFDINKLSLSQNMIETEIVMMNFMNNEPCLKQTNDAWKPKCLHWSPSTGDLLIGMYQTNKSSKWSGKISKYKQKKELTDMFFITNGRNLFQLTENNNGDVIMCLTHAILGKERERNKHFLYKGHESSSKFEPRGICTDAMSHILVCDVATRSVQIIDENGFFLSHLLIRQPRIITPYSLSYDVNTHRLWIGSSDNNIVCVYRYLARQNVLTGK